MNRRDSRPTGRSSWADPRTCGTLGGGGLDLVAILDADLAGRRPGLTARERAVTTWTEAIAWARPGGRAIVQSTHANDPAIQSLVLGDPARFHRDERERRVRRGSRSGRPCSGWWATRHCPTSWRPSIRSRCWSRRSMGGQLVGQRLVADHPEHGRPNREPGLSSPLTLVPMEACGSPSTRDWIAGSFACGDCTIARPRPRPGDRLDRGRDGAFPCRQARRRPARSHRGSRPDRGRRRRNLARPRVRPRGPPHRPGVAAVHPPPTCAPAPARTGPPTPRPVPPSPAETEVAGPAGTGSPRCLADDARTDPSLERSAP